MWVLGTNLGPLHEHQVLLAAEPSLQPLDVICLECIPGGGALGQTDSSVTHGVTDALTCAKPFGVRL